MEIDNEDEIQWSTYRNDSRIKFLFFLVPQSDLFLFFQGAPLLSHLSIGYLKRGGGSCKRYIVAVYLWRTRSNCEGRKEKIRTLRKKLIHTRFYLWMYNVGNSRSSKGRWRNNRLFFWKWVTPRTTLHWCAHAQ